MLYLIRSFTRSGTFLKVGYTGNLRERMKSYLIENPGRELISTRRGELIDETRMHLYLTACGWKADFLDEWFLDCPEVLQGFHQSKIRQERVIWKNRETLFSALDFSRRPNLSADIYEELRFLHRYDSLICSVDNNWKAWNLKKEIQGRKKLIESGYLSILD